MIKEDKQLYSYNNQSGTYRSDAPLESPDSDMFERYFFSKRIAHAISERKSSGSIVMGLYGSLGEGKTTVLNFIQNELSSYQNIITLGFNPCLYQDEFRIIKTFFSSLAITIKKAGFNTSDEYAHLLLETYSELLLQGGSHTITNNLSNGNSSKVSEKFLNNDLKSVRDKIDQVFRCQQAHIVILIDNLDKLEKSNLKTVLKLVKLYANFPNTLFVMAFDKNIVSNLLGSSYGDEKLNHGKKLLAKIVQVPVTIPPFDKIYLEKFYIECINDVLSENKIQLEYNQYIKFLDLFKRSLSIRIKTPRISKQYRNVLSASLATVEKDINIVDFLLIEGISVCYPSLYGAIKNHPDLFQSSAEPDKKFALRLLDKALEPFVVEEKEAAQYLLSYLFPTFGILKDKDPQNESSQDENSFEEELENFFTLLGSEDVEAIKTKIKKLNSISDPTGLISALKLKAEALTEEAGISLIYALGLAGECFINPETVFSFSTAFTHPAIFIKDLLKKISDKVKRFEAAKKLIIESRPFSFTFECYRWICSIEDEFNEERLFDEVLEKELGRTIAGRIAEFAGREPVYISDPERTPFLLSAWSYLSGKETTDRYLRKTFEEDKGNVVLFLKCYLPESSDLSGMSAENTLLGLDQFLSIGNVIEPKQVFTSLLDSLGEEFLIDSATSDRMINKIASKFAETYKSFNFLQPINSAAPESDYLRRENLSDYRRRVTMVKKGIYRPIIPNQQL